MNYFKKSISCILISILFISSLPLIASAESTIITREEALNWLYSVEWTTVNTPYGYAGECASLGYRYYEKLLGREIRANKGGTGNGNDYDDDNHSINLGWSRFAITSSTVLEPGDVIVSNHEPYGHVAILISGTATNATLMHQSNSYLNGVTQRTYNENLIGHTCVRPNWKSSEPPSNATLSINKTVFSVGETVCFSSSCNVGASYTIGIDKDGTRIYTGVVGNYFEKSFSEPGDYSAYVSAWNSMGLVDSNRVNFTVYNSAPSTSKLSIDKSVVVVGEAITFNCEAKNATGYTIGIYKGKERILTQDIGQTFVKSFTEPGEYSAYISAWNANGLVDSNYVGWVVYDSAPTSSELKIDKKAICVGDSIQFTCISKEATGYTIGINKDGVRIFTQDISKMFTKSFNEAGLYTAYVTSWNTRGICDSAKVSFEVYNTIPDDCNIMADKQLAKVGDVVKLKFDANNAKLFEVGTYINGERVWINPTRGDYNELEIELDVTGVYEVWASAYNEYGYCDSEHITFIAYSNDNAVIIKNDNSVRIVKEIDTKSTNYSCIIALYQNRRLVKYLNKPNLNGTTILDETILCSDEYDEIKVMVWSDLSTLKPLCDAEVIQSNEFITE